MFRVDVICTYTVNIYIVKWLAFHWFGGVLPGAEQASVYFDVMTSQIVRVGLRKNVLGKTFYLTKPHEKYTKTTLTNLKTYVAYYSIYSLR